MRIAPQPFGELLGRGFGKWLALKEGERVDGVARRLEASDFLHGERGVFVVVKITGDDRDQRLEGFSDIVLRIEFGDKIVECV